MKKNKQCDMCPSEQAMSLHEWESTNQMVFGRIPIAHLVNLWMKQGFEKDTQLCRDCIIK